MNDIREGLGPKTFFYYDELFCTACGIWPFQTKKSQYFYRLLWVLQELVLSFGEVCELVTMENDADHLLETIPCLLYARSNDISLLFGILSQAEFKGLMNKIQNHWNNLREESEIQILAETVNFGLLVHVSYLGGAYFVIVLCSFLPVVPQVLNIVKPLNVSRPIGFIFEVNYLIDKEKYFYSITTLLLFFALASAVPLFALDLFYMICTMHICGITRILGERIDNISKSESKGKEYKLLCDCIILHQDIFEFCKDINETFHLDFLLVMLLNMILTSFTGIAIVIKMDDSDQINNAIRFFAFGTAQIVHLFMLNYMGQMVLSAVESLEEKIYNVKWYELSPSSAVLVKIMILKNYRPTVMSAVFFTFSLQTFTTVMKTSMSYFTVLKSTR